METSARGLTSEEWEALMDIGRPDSGLPAPTLPGTGTPIFEEGVMDRLVEMGLAVCEDDGRYCLTWIGREFAELRRSGLFALVSATPKHEVTS